MKRRLIWISLIVLLMSSTAMGQSPTKLAIGGFGGLSIPILQDDQGSGTSFGVKGRWGLGNVLVVEPNFTLSKWGEPGTIEGVDLGIDGSKVTSFGVDLVLGNAPGSMGIMPFFAAGIGSYKVKNDDTGYDESKIGYSGALGLGIGLSPKLGIDIRGKLVLAAQEEGSKKALDILLGLNYNFGSEY